MMSSPNDMRKEKDILLKKYDEERADYFKHKPLLKYQRANCCSISEGEYKIYYAQDVVVLKGNEKQFICGVYLYGDIDYSSCGIIQDVDEIITLDAYKVALVYDAVPSIFYSDKSIDPATSVDCVEKRQDNTINGNRIDNESIMYRFESVHHHVTPEDDNIDNFNYCSSFLYDFKNFEFDSPPKRLGEIFGPNIGHFPLPGGSKNRLHNSSFFKLFENTPLKIDPSDRFFDGIYEPWDDYYYKEFKKDFRWSDIVDITTDFDFSGRVINWSISTNPYNVCSNVRGIYNTVSMFDDTLQKYDRAKIAYYRYKGKFVNNTGLPLNLVTWISSVFMLNNSMSCDDLISICEGPCRIMTVDSGDVVEFGADFRPDKFMGFNACDIYSHYTSSNNNPVCSYVNFALTGLDKWPENIGRFICESKFAAKFYNPKDLG